ncbi:MAG: hypothetical protein NC301_04435 [Bacteroides sp.]|nr:hypothetical protein [Bacteroides sp.]MCM1379705.1 hypothetical protein [Bacteroides sp.]MCM1446060.1 hypothetical protein [Prevotella sp.]
MARPIRNTPELYGEVAQRFIAENADVPSLENRIRERERIHNSVNDFLSLIAKHQGE